MGRIREDHPQSFPNTNTGGGWVVKNCYNKLKKRYTDKKWQISESGSSHDPPDDDFRKMTDIEAVNRLPEPPSNTLGISQNEIQDSRAADEPQAPSPIVPSNS